MPCRTYISSMMYLVCVGFSVLSPDVLTQSQKHMKNAAMLVPPYPPLVGVEIFYIEDVDVIKDVVGMVKAPCTEKLSSPTDLLAYAVSAK